MKTNFFKSNLNEDELPNFLANLRGKDKERFLNILGNAHFELKDLNVSDDSDERFFADNVLEYDYSEKLFTRQAREVIEKYTYNYNRALYKNNDEYAETIIKAEKTLWEKYLFFIQKNSFCRFIDKEDSYTESDYAKISDIYKRLESVIRKYFDILRRPKNVELYLEKLDSDGESRLELNRKRINVIKAIKEIRTALNDYDVELDKFLLKCDNEQLKHDIAIFCKIDIDIINKEADKLIKQAENEHALINNKPNFDYIFEYEISPFERNIGKEIW